MKASYARGWRYGAAVAAGVLAAFGVALERPNAGATRSLAAANTQNCAQAAPCLQIGNTGSGGALSGAAKSTSAITGVTRAPNTVFGPHKVNAGVRGEDLSSAPASSTNYAGGLLGFSRTGFGAIGFSRIHAGVLGSTANPSKHDNYGTGGVEGLDSSTDGGQANAGVLGLSGSSNGVLGITTNPSGSAPFGRAAVFGIDESSDGGGRNWGVAGFSGSGTGVLGISLAGPQAANSTFTSALLALCENGGPSVEGADGPLPTANLFLLADCSGNITIEGTVTTGSPPLIATKTRSGVGVTAYSPREAEPSIEDFGRAQLTNGQAHVALDRAFGDAVDPARPYLVFITAEGDNRGLYVAGKSGEGFTVREAQGGHASIGFAYRIVAKPLGDSGARLPHLSAIAERQRASRLHYHAPAHDQPSRFGGDAHVTAMPR